MSLSCTNSLRSVCSRCISRAGRASSSKSEGHVLLKRVDRHVHTRWNSTVVRPRYQGRQDGLQSHHGPRPKITHSIDKLSKELDNTSVVLGGWLFSQRRASPSLSFFTLRDSSSSVQLVSRNPELSERLLNLPLESVILVRGTVKGRKQKVKGIDISMVDEVEIEVSEVTLLNPAEAVLPFYPNRNDLASEDLRAQYRYLDLRRAELAENLKIRSRVAHIIRCHLHDQGFTEIETPILLNSSPEGAREFLVPTRTTSTSTSPTPSFYALQQSPQQPKQLLIASGAIPKYFQLARCFRDEDGRKDRQPEFTQVDLEMAFVDGGAPIEKDGMRSTWAIGGSQVRDVVENLVKRIWREVKGVELEGWFRVMPYEVAMDVYGSDKPDTRYEMYTLPIGYYPSLSDESLDAILLDQRPTTIEWMITPAEHAQHLDVESLIGTVARIHYVKITDRNILTWPQESPLTRPYNLRLESGRPGSAKPGDIIWLAQRKKIPEGGFTHLGRLRTQIMDHLTSSGHIFLPDKPHFLWITQFPLFTRADEDKDLLAKGRWASSHHPFTAPMWEDLEDLKKGNVEGVRGQHYDLVLNGQEIGGGSVRIHDSTLQEYIMRDILQLNPEEMGRFDHLLKALRFGAPPHGGIALGFDRLIAILVGAKSIRDVIAFPKTGAGYDPVFKSPSKAEEEVLKGYGLMSIDHRERRGS